MHIWLHVQLLLPNLRILLLGIVTKEAQGEVSLINHVSYPYDDAINALINPKLCYVKCASFL